MIEVELRTFITKTQYDKLLKKYKNNITTEKQITNYYNCKQDFRLMETKEYSQLWIKGGNMHDEFRKERIIKFDNTYKQPLKDMLVMLEYDVEIKWYRIRNKMRLLNDIDVCIDFTEGYGYILEVEKIVSNQELVDDAKKKLEQFLLDNKISLCEKIKFTEKYEYYKNNWREATKDIIEEIFLD
jgi:adenylate cyclase class IV